MNIFCPFACYILPPFVPYFLALLHSLVSLLQSGMEVVRARILDHTVFSLVECA